MNWTIRNLRHLMCRLRGHDEVLHFERYRLSLQCLDCGHETTGWNLQPDVDRAEPSAVDVSHGHFSGFAGLRKILAACATPQSARITR